MSRDDAVAKLTDERDNQTIRQVVKSTLTAIEEGDTEENEY